MNNFLMLEGGYLVISAFILVVTLYVTTRPFMNKHAFQRIFPLVLGFLVFAIGAHYYITTERMATVQAAFEDGKVIICENKGSRKMGRTVLIEKDTNKWNIENDMFVSELYSRGFHTARCVVHLVQKD